MIDFRIPALHEAYANGLDPAQVVEEVFRRIEEVNDPGIFITLRKSGEILAEAGALGSFDAKARPLWGVPFVLKDNIDVAGIPTTAGCPEFAFTPQRTAFAVRKLLDAGALLIGKTNLDQFATGLVGVRTPYPAPCNAISDDLVPGGSSSGSAVAVAHGLVTFSLGTDTAGSGRVPAALNNIVGLKPTVGAVSASGVVPACRTLDCISVFALSVDDAWAAFTAMAGFDAADPYSRSFAPFQLSAPPPNLRVGIPSASSREFFGDVIAKEAFEVALSELQAIGATFTEIDFAPFKEIAELLYGGPWLAERYEAIRSFIEKSPDAIFPVTRKIIGGASKFSAADAFAGFYKLAALRRQVEPMWRQIDMLAVPSIPTVYTRDEVENDPVTPNSRFGLYTNFVNLLDLSALAVPGKFRRDGRAAGITLIAKAGQDGTLASVGRLFHKASAVNAGATTLKPVYADIATSASSDWIELVVVGAHMSGLPLNMELQAESAEFRRKTTTAPHYSFFALPGGSVARPGLLRVSANEGARIECEVWALPTAGFGRFVSKIPAPLGIGTLELSDGTRVKGFLVEAEGVKGANDISSLGGWRAYLRRGPISV